MIFLCFRLEIVECLFHVRNARHLSTIDTSVCLLPPVARNQRLLVLGSLIAADGIVREEIASVVLIMSSSNSTSINASHLPGWVLKTNIAVVLECSYISRGRIQ